MVPSDAMEMHQPVIHDLGLAATHDVACAVCGERKAILALNQGVFRPCDLCVRDGWLLSHSKWRRRRGEFRRWRRSKERWWKR